MIELAPECPSCNDMAIKQIEHGELEDLVWVAEGWPSEDYSHDQEILFCPFCGCDLEKQRARNEK